MKRVRIDFAPPSLARTLHRTGALAWSLALLALLLCAGAGFIGWQTMARQRALDNQLALVRAQSATPVVVLAAAPPPPVGAPQAAAINAAVMQLNLPWRALRDAVADATPKGVALLALEPDPRRFSMKITAEAKTSDEMIGYIERLKQQELFTAVALQRHEINELDPNKPIRFQIDAQWSAR
ncbi:PilN domain-containing protein [Massilia sp. TWR1-2-2]|uniref:PilN domain-containing protein n=1 Tax=Massilia sp. TWR1-2-2 TaxID=2804584 RepID=UPI003CF2872B